METTEIRIENDCKVVVAHNAMLAGSSFVNVNMTGVTISDANMSDFHIEGAQFGGAVFTNIGMYPLDHPMYDPELEQRPLLFDHCDLHKSTFTNCDLSGVQITSCDLEGMTIEGIAVLDLLKIARGEER